MSAWRMVRPSRWYAFGIPWSTIDKSVVSLASVIACYQNGFFWKIILDRANTDNIESAGRDRVGRRHPRGERSD